MGFRARRSYNIESTPKTLRKTELSVNRMTEAGRAEESPAKTVRKDENLWVPGRIAWEEALAAEAK
jgi:hypothetical protein